MDPLPLLSNLVAEVTATITNSPAREQELMNLGLANQAAAIGKPAKFDLASADGRRLSRDTLKGKVVLIDFWASY
jgi:cytochrome oxidase Cu insertion factor (SCO1/SenC/PrrC family)